MPAAEESDRERVDRVRALLGDDQRPAIGSGGDLRRSRACERLHGARDRSQQTARADAEPRDVPAAPRVQGVERLTGHREADRRAASRGDALLEHESARTDGEHGDVTTPGVDDVQMVAVECDRALVAQCRAGPRAGRYERTGRGEAAVGGAIECEHRVAGGRVGRRVDGGAAVLAMVGERGCRAERERHQGGGKRETTRRKALMNDSFVRDGARAPAPRRGSTVDLPRPLRPANETVNAAAETSTQEG